MPHRPVVVVVVGVVVVNVGVATVIDCVVVVLVGTLSTKQSHSYQCILCVSIMNAFVYEFKPLIQTTK